MSNQRFLLLFLICWLGACTADLEPIVVTRMSETAAPPTFLPSPTPLPVGTATAVAPPTRLTNPDSPQLDEPPTTTPTAIPPTPPLMPTISTTTPLATDSPDTIILTWQQISGRDETYRCQEIAITMSGAVTLSTCLLEVKQTLLQTQLTADQIEQLQTWHNQIQNFTTGYENNAQGPDPWRQNFSFWGKGISFASDLQEGEVRIFTKNVMETVMSRWLDTAAAITEPPIFQGGNVLLLDWSRNGRYLTYFEYTEEQIAVNPNYLGGAEGTFTIYDTTTGTKCQDYPLSGNYAYEGSGLGERHLWLPNGDLFLLTEQGDSFQIATPCQEQAVPLFAEPFQHIASLSPDESTLVLGGVTGYWLYNWQAQTSWAMDAEIPPSTYNSLAWSPDGRYLAITAVDYDRKPIGTTWMVETATGTILTRHDWQAMTALDGIFGSPVWLNNEEVLITMTEDGEPFFMTVTGEILPLLPLFPATDRDLPRAYVYVGSNSYHILLTEFGSATPPVQIYHSDTDQVETLATTTTDIYLGLDGQIIADRTDTDYLSRFITVADVPLMRVHPQCYPDDSVPPIGYYAKQMADQRIQIWHIPDCSLVASLNLGEAGAETNYFQTRFAPNNKWLAVVPFDNLGRGKTLFVLPLAEVLP